MLNLCPQISFFYNLLAEHAESLVDPAFQTELRLYVGVLTEAKPDDRTMTFYPAATEREGPGAAPERH